jgi:hypothetical protein
VLFLRGSVEIAVVEISVVEISVVEDGRASLREFGRRARDRLGRRLIFSTVPKISCALGK